MNEYDELALFRYRLIAPLLDPNLERGERQQILKHQSGKWYTHPTTKNPVQFKSETIRDWLKRYRKQGFDGLSTKSRSDKGTVKSIPDTVLQEVVNMKLENPRRTIDGIIQSLERAGKVAKNELKRSTLHRVFQARNINVRKLKPSAVFGRFEAAKSNDLWQSDLLYGPKIPDPNRAGKFFPAQLFAFIDDHSRLITHAEFYHHSRTTHLESCLKKALQKYGLPKVLYVDNGSQYRSNKLTSICAHLGIQLRFAKPYAPEGKGKVEKFFSYVRSNFLVEVETHPVADLNQLNQAFWAWLEQHYHRKVHTTTNETPKQRFMQHANTLRYAADPDLYTAFLEKETRKIRKDRTFSLLGRIYEVLAGLVNQSVTIFYDPDDLDEVRVFLGSEFFQTAKLLRIERRAAPKVQAQVPAKVKSAVSPLADLIQAHKETKEEELMGKEIIYTPSDGRFTKRQFLEILNRHSFQLDPAEEKLISDFFDQYGPIQNTAAEKCLNLTINQVGTQKHISFYLDLLKGESPHA